MTLFQLVVVLVVVFLPIALVLPTLQQRREGNYPHCKNNLKYIGLALHNYKEEHGVFPPAYTIDDNGKPLHSWRTLILPYLDQKSLYDKIDLSVAWDAPANEEARNTRVRAYECPVNSGQAFQTTYLALVTEESGFRAHHSVDPSEMTDNWDWTVMIIEVAPQKAVHWMSPMDADESAMMSFGKDPKSPHAKGTHTMLLDGSVGLLPSNLDAKSRKAMITVSGSDDGVISKTWRP